MKLKTAFMAAVVGLGVGSGPTRSAEVPPHMCPADSELANLVAGSDAILVGRMDVAKQRLAEEAGKSSPHYVNIPIQIEAVLKGGDLPSAIVRFYPKDADYQPSIDAVGRLSGERAILFLSRGGEKPDDLYFAGYTPDALRPATEATLVASRAETLRQARIVSSWRPDPAARHVAEVRKLIARLGHVSGAEQQRVFDLLLALGDEAVPAIIAQMDDRRILRTHKISLANHARDAFESVRHCGPKQVVDGLDAVLNQITGAFGSIQNGGSMQKRDAAVARWRIFAADLACKKCT